MIIQPSLPKKMKRLLLVVFLLQVYACYSQGLVVKNDDKGISLLSYRSLVLYSRDQRIGVPFSAEAHKVIRKGGKQELVWSHQGTITQIPQRNAWKMVYNFGELMNEYQQVKDTLFMTLTITNTSKSDTLAGVNIIPLQFKFPQRPNGFRQYFPYYHYNLDGPTVIPADYGAGKVVLSNEDVAKPVFVGLLDVNNPDGILYKVWVSAVPFNGMQTQGIPNIEDKIAPGKSVRYQLALRFYPSGTPDEKVAVPVVAKYRAHINAKSLWSDRRPLGALYLSSVTKQNPAANPRGWLPWLNISTRSADDIRQLRKEILAFATRSIANLKKINAQGMITWDIEGQEFPHAISYVGSPDKLPQVAPEMDAIADEYFAMFKQAGLKTGICIRPQEFILSKDGKSAVQKDVKDPAIVLIRKIKYARKRWGCTIFYVDSNVDEAGALLDAAFFKKVHEAVPDVLLIPEHQNMKYFEFTAPFEEMRFGGRMVDALTNVTYPSSFFVLTVSEAIFDPAGKRLISDEELKRSLQQGNVFLFRAWYDDEPTNSLVKKLVAEVNYNQKSSK